MKKVIIAICVSALAVSGCARPREVRSLSESMYPIAVELKQDSGNLQKRFALHRELFESRAIELRKEAQDSQFATLSLEKQWRMADDKGRLRRLSILRERDDEIRANPLLTVLADPKFKAGKPPKMDQGPIDAVIKSIDGLRKDQSLSLGDIWSYWQDANDQLKKIDEEQSPDIPADGS